jgi:hypothetical protein
LFLTSGEQIFGYQYRKEETSDSLPLKRTSSFINSVEQLQTLPKTQSEIDISPFLKTQKPSSTLSKILMISDNVEFLPPIFYAVFWRVRIIAPTARYSDGPLFRQPIIPTAHYSDGPFFRQCKIELNLS